MRVHLTKHLKSRSHTIRQAVKQYNSAAKHLEKPRDPIKFDDVLHYTCAGEFDLLRDTQRDILQRPWSEPYNRIIRDRWFKTERAREEICRLDVEIARIQSWMVLEERQYLDAAHQAPPPLNALLLHRYEKVCRRNHQIQKDLARIPLLFGYNPTFTFNTSIHGDTMAEIDLEDIEDIDDGLPSDLDEDEEAAGVDNFEMGVARVEQMG